VLFEIFLEALLLLALGLVLVVLAIVEIGDAWFSDELATAYCLLMIGLTMKRVGGCVFDLWR